MAIFERNDIIEEYKGKLKFKYFYFFVILLYCAQPHYALEGLNVPSSNYVLGMLIPPVLTAILLFKHRVFLFDETFMLLVGIVILWLVAHIIIHGEMNRVLSLFLLYGVFMTNVMVKEYGKDLFVLFEHFVFRLTLVALFFWILSIVSYPVTAAFFHLFGNGIQDWTEGSCFLYTMMCKRHDFAIHNAGFCWEPGRFACFVIIAMYLQLARNDFNINGKFFVYLIALLTARSTTGIFLLFLIFIIWAINTRQNHRFIAIILAGVTIFFMLKFDFATDKLNHSIEIVEERAEQYGSKTEAYSLDRFESLALDYENFIHNPLIGFGERRYSYFEQMWRINMNYNNGFAELFAQYGVILALLYLICLFKTSRSIANSANDRFSVSLALLLIGINMSYSFILVVIFSSMALMNFLSPKTKTDESIYNNK